MTTSARALSLVLAIALLLGTGPAHAAPTTSVTSDERPTAQRTAYARAAAITLRGPVDAQVGGTLVLTGRVLTKRGKVRRPRPVQVAEQVGGRWVVVGRARSKKSGAFKVTIPAGASAVSRVLRAQAPRAHRLRAVRSPWLSVRVSDGSADWSFLMDGGSRWNPCAPITWSYNPTGQAYDALGDVTTALAKIAEVSGLVFQYAGATAAVYVGDEDVLSGGAALVIGWASATQLTDLAESVVGVGGAVGTGVSGRDVAWKLTRGWVTLDNADPLDPAPGFGASSYGQVLMHEVLHALGLGHAEQPQQLMYPVAGPQNTTFGPGDLAGIARIGAAAGCL